MVLIYDSISEIDAVVRGDLFSVILSFKSRAVKFYFSLLPKGAIFLRTCTTWCELPSSISTMAYSDRDSSFFVKQLDDAAAPSRLGE